MSLTYISVGLRQSVRERAKNRCEYCGIHESDTEYGCEVDHIISEKHLGRTVLGNLALACFFCNRNKGSDLGSIREADDPVLVRFFNPRIDLWTDHFYLDPQKQIVPKTDIGSVTMRILGFNAENRVLERRAIQG